MRQTVGKTKKVRAGDTVRIFTQLAGSNDLARLYVWAAYGDSDFAPYIPSRMAGLMEQGKPMMVSPVSVRLSEHRRKHTLEFIAEEDMRVCVKEERDMPGPATAKVRIAAHGPAFENFLRRLRNLFGGYRRRDDARHAH